VLANKPRHWLEWFDGQGNINVEAPPRFVPAQLSADQIREINAMTHIENELIDEACGRVLARLEERGLASDTDVFFSSDHGEFQGDFGLLFKGPYHVDALMRVPLIWRPAPSAGIAPAEIEEPVGHIDLAATFCEIAGAPLPSRNQGHALPTRPGGDREQVLTEWDCTHRGTTTRMRSIFRDGVLCTAYEKSNFYAGSEGELYDLRVDPYQFENLWDVPEKRRLRDELSAQIYASLPPMPATWPEWRAPV
jgi:arylsulfatase A-like enzyme